MSPCSHEENGCRKFKRTACASRISLVTLISVVTELNSKGGDRMWSLSSCAIRKSIRFWMFCVQTRPKISFLSAMTCVQEQLPLHCRRKTCCLPSLFPQGIGKLTMRRSCCRQPLRAAKQTAIYKTQGQHRLAFFQVHMRNWAWKGRSAATFAKRIDRYPIYRTAIIYCQ